MAFNDPLLTARTLILAKIESTYNQDANPVNTSDAFLVSEADVRVDPNVLERNNFRPSFSPTAVVIGRKLVTVTFSHEIKASGTVGSVSKLGTLLRGCGFAETTIASTPAATINNPAPGTGNTGTLTTPVKDTAPTSRFFGRYTLYIVTAGGSGVAQGQWVGDPFYEGDTTIIKAIDYSVVTNDSAAGAITVSTADLTAPTFDFTAGGANQWVQGDNITINVGGIPFSIVVGATPTDVSVATQMRDAVKADTRFNVAGTDQSLGVLTIDFDANSQEFLITDATNMPAMGASGAIVADTIGTALVVGDTFEYSFNKPGVHYDPVSSAFESLTIYIYFDGLLHKVTGCMGTVSFNGAAGNFGTAAFTFTGQYTAPTDTALPTGSVYESSAPVQIESAALTLEDLRDVCAESFSVDMNVEVTPRDCINQTDGFNGVTITNRDPQGGVNPEVQLEANHSFWSRFSDATKTKFHVAVGTTAGNIVHFSSRSSQYSGLTYADRNGTRTYDVGLRFSADTADGDDEIKIVFA